MNSFMLILIEKQMISIEGMMKWMNMSNWMLKMLGWRPKMF